MDKSVLTPDELIISNPLVEIEKIFDRELRMVEHRIADDEEHLKRNDLSEKDKEYYRKDRAEAYKLHSKYCRRDNRFLGGAVICLAAYSIGKQHIKIS